VVPTDVLLGLLLAALAAGWVDAVSGGGGLIQLPSLLIALPREEPATAFGTNKLSSVLGTTAAMITYLRRPEARPDLRTALPMALAAFIGSGLGAAAATSLPASLLRPMVLILLVAVGLWTWFRPALGSVEVLRWQGRRRHVFVATAAGGIIGFYDGIFGPGTGSFLVFLLVGLLGYSFLRASSTAKVVNVGTNVAAISVFAPSGHVLWQLGLAMGVANLIGGITGARMAVKHGSGFVRTVFLVVVIGLILRLAIDVLL
jgi:uncharacterized protein